MKFPSLNKFLTETPSNSHTAPEKGPNQGDTCRMQCEQKQSMFSSRVFFFFIGSEEESHLEYQEKECQCGNERLHQWSWLNFYTSEAGRVRYINLSVLKLISSLFPLQQPIKQRGSTDPVGYAEFRTCLLLWDSRLPFFNMAIKLFIFQLLGCSSHIPLHLPKTLTVIKMSDSAT